MRAQQKFLFFRSAVLASLLVAVLAVGRASASQSRRHDGGKGGKNACSITSTSSLPTGQATFGDYGDPDTFLVVGFAIPVDCATAQVSYYVTIPDPKAHGRGNQNIYDVGIYCVSGHCTPGRLYVHTGPIPGSKFAPAEGMVTLPWKGVSQGNPVTLPAGLYAVAMGSTCSGTCAQGMAEGYYGRIQPFAMFRAGPFSASGLPSSFSPPPLEPQITAPKMVDFLFF
jgi:hypothetical protein